MKKIFILLLFALTIGYQAEAQKSQKKRKKPVSVEKSADNTRDNTNSSATVEDEELPKEIFTAVEKMPYYPDGQTEGFQKYLKTHLIYPEEAKKAGIKGKVYVTFVVKPDGKIVNPVILKGLGFGCDEEAIRLIRNAPLWVPGSQNGRKVYVKYTVPVPFNP